MVGSEAPDWRARAGEVVAFEPAKVRGGRSFRNDRKHPELQYTVYELPKKESKIHEEDALSYDLSAILSNSNLTPARVWRHQQS